MVRIKNCCLSTNQQPRFDAGIGDHVLIQCDEQSFMAGVIKSVSSTNNVTVALTNGNRKTVSAVEIVALML